METKDTGREEEHTDRWVRTTENPRSTVGLVEAGSSLAVTREHVFCLPAVRLGTQIP